MPDIPRMLTIRETAAEFNLPQHFIRQLCIGGQIAVVKAGKKYLVNAGRFADYLNNPPPIDTEAALQGGIRRIME